MKKDQVPAKQIVLAIASLFDGKTEEQICMEMKITPVVFKRWLKKYGEIGYQHNLLVKENKRLQRMFTDVSIVNQFLNVAINELKMMDY